MSGRDSSDRVQDTVPGSDSIGRVQDTVSGSDSTDRVQDTVSGSDSTDRVQDTVIASFLVQGPGSPSTMVCGVLNENIQSEAQRTRPQ